MKLRIIDKSGRAVRMDVPAPKKPLVKDEGCEKSEVQDKEEALTAAEIKKLKLLIPHLDELLTLLDLGADDDFDKEDLDYDEDLEKAKEEAEEEEEVEEKSETEIVEDDADVKVEEEEEEEETKVLHDSKSVVKSFGSVRRKKVNDSADPEIDTEAEIAEAWNKRYGG